MTAWSWSAGSKEDIMIVCLLNNESRLSARCQTSTLLWLKLWVRWCSFGEIQYVPKVRPDQDSNLWPPDHGYAQKWSLLDLYITINNYQLLVYARTYDHFIEHNLCWFPIISQHIRFHWHGGFYNLIQNYENSWHLNTTYVNITLVTTFLLYKLLGNMNKQSCLWSQVKKTTATSIYAHNYMI